MNLLDAQNDPGYANLHVIISQFPKIASVTDANMDMTELTKLSDSCFACPELRKFPIHTRGHAAVSLGYAKLAAANLPVGVLMELEKAVEAYGIADVFKEQEKTASVVNLDECLLPDKQRFRVSSAEDVIAFSPLFREKLASYPIEDKLTIGYRFGQAADKYGVKLAGNLQRLTFTTLTDTQALRDQFSARAEAAYRIGADKFAEIFENLREDFVGAPLYLSERPEQIKLANALNDLDKTANIQQFYNRGIADPLTAVFNTEFPTSQFFKLGSALCNRDLLTKLPLSFWGDALGPEAVAEIAPGGVLDVTLLEQVISTLPADLKANLETQLAAYNI